MKENINCSLESNLNDEALIIQKDIEKIKGTIEELKEESINTSKKIENFKSPIIDSIAIGAFLGSLLYILITICKLLPFDMTLLFSISTAFSSSIVNYIYFKDENKRDKNKLKENESLILFFEEELRRKENMLKNHSNHPIKENKDIEKLSLCAFDLNKCYKLYLKNDLEKKLSHNFEKEDVLEIVDYVKNEGPKLKIKQKL